MCSIFVSTMDNNYQFGDLTDILRASGGTSSSPEPPAPPQPPHHHQNHWHQHQNQHQLQHQFSSDPMIFNNFGDPFSTFRDPLLLQDLDIPSVSSYFNTSTTDSGGLEQAVVAASGFGGVISGNSATNNTNVSASSVFAHKVVEDNHDMMRRPCKNIFSNMIQISPNCNAKLPGSYDSSSTSSPAPRPIKPSAVISPNININAANTEGVQISSPRNPGLKRRKNQAKKVVCIPAPAAANSRQTGEVVPSDLWAWRKYGQKPIKGSPYPRGYYRCSSSKGCSARKQVERSRTDPNMLVITYTSEHNHPWPTQRNALAGSTRSQPSKSNNAASKSSEIFDSQKGTLTKPKEEHEQESNSEGNNSPGVAAGNSSNSVKEEMEDMEMKQLENMEDGEFSDGIGIPYKPSMIGSNNQQSEDFFAELGEIEADPLNLLFTQGFGHAPDEHQRESTKAIDPFHIFDWSNTTNTNSFDEPNKRRL